MKPLFPRFQPKTAPLQLEMRSELQRKREFLRALTNGLLVLHAIALAVSATSGANSATGPIMVVVSGLICLAFRYSVQRYKPSLLPCILFCAYFNSLLLLVFMANVLEDTAGANTPTVVFMGYFLTINVLFSGILIRANAAIIFALIDVTCIAAGYSIAEYTLISSFPLITFVLLTAMISWLYERTISRAHERLKLAQERILQDELVRRDLDIARDLQQRLYPEPPKGHSQVIIASRSEPARETSGDFYDFIELGDNQLGIVIADVTGKSLAAALVMAMVRSTFRCEAHHSQSPAEVLRRVNEILCLDHSVKQMVTAWYGVLDTRSLLLRAANAGHPFPMLLRDGEVTEIEAVGLPLRARTGTVYAEQTTQLRPADLLVLLSDGLVEAMNGSRELFGFDRFAASLEHQSALQPRELIDHLWRQIDEFRAGVEQNDDMTLVVVGCERVPGAVPVAESGPALAISQPTGAP